MLLPRLRFSILYPTILVPPVLVGGDHAKVMQFLKALTTLGVDGGPGYAGTNHDVYMIMSVCLHYQ